MWLAMLPLHSRSMSGVVAHVLRKAEVCYCGWCLQRCELWIRLQWFMDPSQANYRPQLQSCLPGGSRRNCLILQALFQIHFQLGLGDFEETGVRIYWGEGISVGKHVRTREGRCWQGTWLGRRAVCNYFRVLHLLLYQSENPAPLPAQEKGSLAVQPPPSLAKKSKELTGRSVPKLWECGLMTSIKALTSASNQVLEQEGCSGTAAGWSCFLGLTSSLVCHPPAGKCLLEL